MTTEIIDSILIGPYFMDTGDVIHVLEGGVVDSSAGDGDEGFSLLDVGMTTRTSSDTDITLRVDGIVLGSEYGIMLDRFYSDDGSTLISNSTLIIGETGEVSGKNAIVLGYGEFNTLLIAGKVTGSDYITVWVQGDHAQVDVSGEVYGQVGIEISGDYQSLDISGTVTGTKGSAVFFEQSNDSNLDNSGRISGAVFAQGSDDLTISNTGSIYSEGGSILLVGCNDVTIDNQGRIVAENIEWGSNGLELIAVSGVFKNSGTLTSEGNGSDSNSYLETTFLVHNTGLIRGDKYSIFHGRGDLDVKNFGRIVGDYFSYDAEDWLINGGRIDGDVLMNELNDYYRAEGTGYVTGQISGGAGDDTLIGGSCDDTLLGNAEHDRLLGNAGRDTLFGGGGDDTLNGGDGADRITGGQGDDRLTGGQGADVFAFAASSGHDRLRDFAPGRDSFEITDHTGGFDALTIRDRGAHLDIAHDGGTITLIDGAGTMLTAADFDFL